MTTSLHRLAFTAAALATTLLASQSASALTLNTTGLKANAVLTFSPESFGASSAAGIKFTPLGNTVQNADVPFVDPETGLTEFAPQFVLPVTKADVSVGWDLKITANSGISSRSALQIQRLRNRVVLANFQVDFKGKLVNADYITGITAPTTTAGSVYSFEEIVPQKISLKGLVLNQTVTLGKMFLTDNARNALGTGLALSAPLQAALVALEWGTIDIQVTSYKRPNTISDKPFTAADIPAAN